MLFKGNSKVLFSRKIYLYGVFGELPQFRERGLPGGVPLHRLEPERNSLGAVVDLVALDDAVAVAPDGQIDFSSLAGKSLIFA